MTWKTQQIIINIDKCLGEGECERICPFMVFKIKKINGKKKATVENLENCFICQACQSKCPTNAITITW